MLAVNWNTNLKTGKLLNSFDTISRGCTLWPIQSTPSNILLSMPAEDDNENKYYSIFIFSNEYNRRRHNNHFFIFSNPNKTCVTGSLTLLSLTDAEVWDQELFPSLQGAPNSHEFETKPHPISQGSWSSINIEYKIHHTSFSNKEYKPRSPPCTTQPRYNQHSIHHKDNSIQVLSKRTWKLYTIGNKCSNFTPNYNPYQGWPQVHDNVELTQYNSVLDAHKLCYQSQSPSQH